MRWFVNAMQGDDISSFSHLNRKWPVRQKQTMWKVMEQRNPRSLWEFNTEHCAVFGVS